MSGKKEKKAPAKAGASHAGNAASELESMLDELRERSMAGAPSGELLILGRLVEAELLRPRVESGDVDAMLSALYFVSYHGHKVRTLDEAFGVSRPKSYHLKASRDRWDKAPMVVFGVLQLHAHGVAISDPLFETLGLLYGVGKTKASEYFYFHKNRHSVTYQAALSVAGKTPLSEDLRGALKTLSS